MARRVARRPSLEAAERGHLPIDRSARATEGSAAGSTRAIATQEATNPPNK